MTDEGGEEYDFHKIMAEKGFTVDQGSSKLSTGQSLRAHPGNPSGVALEFIAEWRGERLVWRGEFYKYTGTRWAKENTDDVMAEINRELVDSVCEVFKDKKLVKVPWNPTPTSLAALRQQLLLLASLPSTEEPVAGGEFIFLENGRYSISTGLLLPHDSRMFNIHSSPFSYDPKAQCPEFDRLLEESFGGDVVAIERHLRWMAVELLHAVDMQKGYVLIGQPGSGKGTLMRVSNALLGYSQVGGMSLDQLAGGFSLAPLVGKNVCRINDVRDAGKSTGPAVQRLLAIIGGDQVMIDIKGVQGVMTTLPVLFTMESNEEPRLPDASGAIMRRLIFNNTVGTRQMSMDPGLAQRIIDTEMPGVLNRVLEWAPEVYGEWPETEASTETKESMRRVSQPLLAWVEETGLGTGAALTLERNEAYNLYLSWAHSNGTKYPMEKAVFVKRLKATMPEVALVRRGGAGKQVWIFEGLGIVDSGGDDGS